MSRKMRRKIRSYIVFTSLPYRIIVYFALPVVVAATGFWAGTQGIGDGGVMFAAVLLPLAEIISDNWLFNGIQSRDMAKMDYLKTSGRGMAVMRDALVMDLLRKFLTAAGSMALCAAAIELWKVGGMPGAPEGMSMGGMAGTGIFARDFSGIVGRFHWVGILFYFVLLSWFLSGLGTFLSRYACMVWINMLIGYIASILAALGLFGIGLWQYIWFLAAFAGAAGVLAGVLAVKAAMKKVEGGYYDK